MTESSLAETRVEDFTGGAVALIEGALAAHGQLNQAERTLFVQVVAEQNLELDAAFSYATRELTTMLGQAYHSPAYRRLQATENQIVASPAGRPIPVSSAAFQANANAVQAVLRGVEVRQDQVLAAQSASLTNSLKTELYLAAGLGLAALAASVFVAVRFGRRLRLELTGLYDSARQMAEQRLPRLVERLWRGDDVDVEAESPSLKTGRITEIAECRAGVHGRAADRGRGRGRPGGAAQGRQPGVRQPVAAQPVPAAPPAVHAGRDGAGHQRPGRAGRPVPA
jgi:hypothetical protein